LLGCMALTGCGVRLDMHIQPKMKPLRESDFYADKRGSRPLLPNTVARGELHEDTFYYTGMVNGKEADAMPFPVNAEVLQRGQERYNIYCAPCHSRVGDGNGMIVQRGFRRPPSYLDPKLVNAPIGHFYDVISRGYGVMPDYAVQVDPHDRWAIAAYIRVLQFSQHAPGAMAAGKPMDTQIAAGSAEAGAQTTQAPGPDERRQERK